MVNELLSVILGRRMNPSKKEEFDPYHEWFGIPKSEQPANHYRLLGLPCFESKPKVIENAYDQKMAFLRTKQLGEQAVTSQRLQCELTAAVRVLLDDNLRTKYDASLAADSSPVASSTAPTVPEIRSETLRKSKAKKTSKVEQSHVMAMVGGGVTIVVVLIGVIIWAASNSRPVAKKTAPAAATKSEKKSPPIAVRNESRKTEERVSPSVAKAPSPPPPRVIMPPVPSPPTNSNEKPTPEKKMPVNATRISVATEIPVGEELDLLALVKLPDHIVEGTWRRQDNGLLCEAKLHTRFMAPVAVTGSYQLTCKFTRKEKREGIHFSLPVGDTGCIFLLDGFNGTVGGLQFVDGRTAKNSVGTSDAVKITSPLTNGVAHSASITVSQEGDNAAFATTLDGKDYFSWKGRCSQLTQVPAAVLPQPRTIGVWTQNIVVEIHELKFKLLPGGRGYRLGDDWKNPLTVIANEPPSEVVAQCLDWNGKKYLISDMPMSLAAAQQLAMHLQGRLLTISSPEEERFLFGQGREWKLWMAGWRPPNATLDWRDERNRPLRFLGTWAAKQPDIQKGSEWQLYCYTGGNLIGWHDVASTDSFHACIEWGEEYPADATAGTEIAVAPKTASPNINGVWQEEPHIFFTVSQEGENFTATTTYKHKNAGEIQAVVKGTISKEGKITADFHHTKCPANWVKDQKREATLSADGRTIRGHAFFAGGGHDFVWTRKE